LVNIGIADENGMNSGKPASVWNGRRCDARATIQTLLGLCSPPLPGAFRGCVVLPVIALCFPPVL
jgi:hypothetical protein